MQRLRLSKARLVLLARLYFFSLRSSRASSAQSTPQLPADLTSPLSRRLSQPPLLRSGHLLPQKNVDLRAGKFMRERCQGSLSVVLGLGVNTLHDEVTHERVVAELCQPMGRDKKLRALFVLGERARSYLDHGVDRSGRGLPRACSTSQVLCSEAACTCADLCWQSMRRVLTQQLLYVCWTRVLLRLFVVEPDGWRGWTWGNAERCSLRRPSLLLLLMIGFGPSAPICSGCMLPVAFIRRVLRLRTAAAKAASAFCLLGVLFAPHQQPRQRGCVGAKSIINWTSNFHRKTADIKR